MRICFFIYDSSNTAATGVAEIRFKTYLHGVYQTRIISQKSHLDKQIYEESFEFSNEAQVYYSFRNNFTNQQSDARTITVSQQQKAVGEFDVTVFIDLKFDVSFSGSGYSNNYNYTSGTGTTYSSYSTYGYGSTYGQSSWDIEKYMYLKNFVTSTIDSLTMKKLIAYMRSIQLGYQADRQNLAKAVSGQLLIRALPQKLSVSQQINFEEVFNLIDLIDKETRESEPYSICRTLARVCNLTSDVNYVSKAIKDIEKLSQTFKIIDWLKEISIRGFSVTSQERRKVYGNLETKFKAIRLDSEPSMIMTEITRITNESKDNDTLDDFTFLKSSIMRRCYDEQTGDTSKMKFLFKHLNVLVQGLGRGYVQRGFEDLLNKRRDSWQQRDILREVAQNAKTFIKYFDVNGELLQKHITQDVFVKDLFEGEQICILEALHEGGIGLDNYPWKKVLVESIRSYRSIDEVTRVMNLLITLAPQFYLLPLLKKYFTERVHYFYVNFVEKIRMRYVLIELLHAQVSWQKVAQQNSETKGEDLLLEEEDYNVLDTSIDEWDYQTDVPSKGMRGNRFVEGKLQTAKKMKVICEAKYLAEAEVIDFETFVKVNLGDVLKRLNTIELLKDAKLIKDEEAEAMCVASVGFEAYVEAELEANFGKVSMREEWNFFPNFKEKFEKIKSLAAEKCALKQSIASIVKRKYVESAESFYAEQLRVKKSPQHFHEKNLLEFLEESKQEKETAVFRQTFTKDFQQFIDNHEQISISQLKTFLAAKDITKLFEVTGHSLDAFKLKCLKSIQIFDEKLESIGSLFRNFRDFFPEQQVSFATHFNLEQKACNIISLANQFAGIEEFMQFNYFLRDSQVYQSIKKQVIHAKQFKNEHQAFKLIKEELIYFVSALVRNRELDVPLLDGFTFVNASDKAAEEAAAAIVQPSVSSINSQLLQEVQAMSGNNIELIDALIAGIAAQQQQQQPVQQQQQVPHMEAEEQQLAQALAQIADQESLALHAEQQQQQLQEQGHVQEEAQVQLNQQPAVIAQPPVVIAPTRVFSMIDLKTHSGGTFASCLEHVTELLDLLEVYYDHRSLQQEMFEIYAVDFLRRYMSDIQAILEQHCVDLSDVKNAQIAQSLAAIEKIEKFQETAIYKIVKEEFRDILTCFHPVTQFHPRLIELLRRSEEIVTFSIENFSGSEGRGFLDLNDIIDDQDVDISSLIIKLNQSTPFINTLVSIKKECVQQQQDNSGVTIDVKNLLTRLFETVGRHLSAETDQINFEDSLNNFYKIKNMSLTFDKKKSYILISQQIVTEGTLRVHFDPSSRQVIIEAQISDDTLYTEEEINTICSKVIIEQNTTNIVINQARKAGQQKNDNQIATSSSEETVAEETLLQQSSAAIKHKIDQFKDMWGKLGELKAMLTEMITLGYFDMHKLTFNYENSTNSVEQNFAQITVDKHSVQGQLKDWKAAIRSSCQKFPLFSLLGHNLYSDQLEFLSGKKSYSELPKDLQDILKIPVLNKKIQTTSVTIDGSDFTPSEKLLKIASWFKLSQSSDRSSSMEIESSETGVIASSSASQVEGVFFSGMKELVDIIFRVSEREEAVAGEFEFYQYFNCDSHSQVQDFDLFIHRFEYLVSDNPKTFVIILSEKLDAIFTYRAIETIEQLTNSSSSTNKLLVLAKREIYSELLSSLSSTSVEDFLARLSRLTAETQPQQPRKTASNTQFFISNAPGAGKSYQIAKILSKNENVKNNVRIAINGLGSKSDLISLFRSRLSSCEKTQPIYLHLDVYPIEQYDLNLLLFEITTFRSLSIHQKQFIDIGGNVNFFVEINNTLKNDLLESLFVKEHFKCVNVKFSIDDYDPDAAIVGYNAYTNAAVVSGYLSLMAVDETMKNVFDQYEEGKKNENGGEDGEGEEEEEENEQAGGGEEEGEEEEEEGGREGLREEGEGQSSESREEEVEEEEERRDLPAEHAMEAEQVNPNASEQQLESIIVPDSIAIPGPIVVPESIVIPESIVVPVSVVEQQQSEQQQQAEQNQSQVIIAGEVVIDVVQIQPEVVDSVASHQMANISNEICSQSSNRDDALILSSINEGGQAVQDLSSHAANSFADQSNNILTASILQREVGLEAVGENSILSKEGSESNSLMEVEDMRNVLQPVAVAGEQQVIADNVDRMEAESAAAAEALNEEGGEWVSEAQIQAEADEAFARKLQEEDGGFDMGMYEDFLSKPTYRIDSLKYYQQLLKKYFVDRLVASDIEPCFHQLTNFINLFGSEMQKFEKCFFLEKSILYELEPQLLEQGLRSKVVELSLQLAFLVSTNQAKQANHNPNNANEAVMNRNRREYILHEKAEKIQRFSELITSFVTFQEQENPSLTSFFPTAALIPQVISNLYTIQGQNEDLIHFDQTLSQDKLLKWLNMLINRFGDVVSPEVQSRVKRLAIQKDNFFKIAMIFMRIRALSPIILMGEAGTGKTALIELLSALMEANFFTMNIHAGIGEKEVIEFIYKSIASVERTQKKVIIFFDEMNTNRLVEGIFKEIIVDRCLKGERLPDCFIPITAINPYKLKSKEQKAMFSLQVHGGVKREVMSRMNNTDLEYMVEPLPESLYSFIWNIDHLSEDEESQYIAKIVHFRNEERQQKKKRHFDSEQLMRIMEMLVYSQRFLRKIMGCQSACSLRDVARFAKLLFWFYDFLVKCVGMGLVLNQIQECAINLALYVGYCVRIPLYKQRKEYQLNILHSKEAQNDVEAVQTYLASQIEVPKGIVKNTAFKQNTLTLFASIMNKIPVILIGRDVNRQTREFFDSLFDCLIGQPGCTKTLSLRLLIQSLRGDQSKSQLFKSLKTLVPIYYQGHVQSTSERIMEVFSNANKKQAKIELDQQQKRYLSLVYLEEIGLAEISPHNPLKVLHQALENPKVAVACISNWPLDQSKMNRMLSVYRLDTSKKELIETVECIFEELVSFEKDEALCKVLLAVGLNRSFSKQAVGIYKSYNALLKMYLPEHEQFHGLRDFYGMAKLFCYKYLTYLMELLGEQVGDITQDLSGFDVSRIIVNAETVQEFLVKAYERHFSGLTEGSRVLKLAIQQVLSKKEEEEEKAVVEGEKMDVEGEDDEEQMVLEKPLPQLSQEPSSMKLSMQRSTSSKLNNSLTLDEVQLIEENLVERSKYFLSRHLMIITHDTQKALEYLLSRVQGAKQQAAKVFLGSDFPEDKKSETSYQIINEIISCVESGVFVVLQNLEHVYQSLYELLNQNYHYYNGKYFCRVSLGADTSNVEVNSNFKLILIANHIQIPCLSGPLLNRFEKHIFEQSMILTEQDCHEIASIEKYFQQGQANGGGLQIFDFTNFSQVVESLYLQQKQMLEEGSPQLVKQRVIELLHHQAAFKGILFFSNDQDQVRRYIESGYHFGLKEFVQERIVKRVNEKVRAFCVFSSQTYSSQQKTMQCGAVSVEIEVIHLAEITSQMHLTEKLSEFFGKVVKEEDGSLLPLLIIVCDMDEDPIERIIFTKQKIAEAAAVVTGQSALHRVIMTVRVSDKFLMLPSQLNWEHYYIDELVPFTSVQSSAMREQMDLSRILGSQSVQFQRFFNIETLFEGYLKSEENISIMYRKVRYQNDQMSYRSSRLAQLKFLLLNPQNAANLTIFGKTAIQILCIKFGYVLTSMRIQTVGEFLTNQVFKKGFVYQASSILKAIVSAFEDIIQQSLCFFVELLEKQQVVHCLRENYSDDSTFGILLSRVMRQLDVTGGQGGEIIGYDTMKQLAVIQSNPNVKFTAGKTTSLLSVSFDLLSPIEQSQVIISVVEKQMQFEATQLEKQSLSSISARVIGQLNDLVSVQEMKDIVRFSKAYAHDYLLLRSAGSFTESHAEILERILPSVFDDEMMRIVSIIIEFERHQKAILKAHGFIEYFTQQVAFKWQSLDFEAFVEKQKQNLRRNDVDQMVMFNLFIVHSVFECLHYHIQEVSKKRLVSLLYTKLLRHIDSLDLMQSGFSVVDRIVQTSKLIIQFSEEILDENYSSRGSSGNSNSMLPISSSSKTYEIFKSIDFEEIRNLNFYYIQNLKETVRSQLFDEEDQRKLMQLEGLGTYKQNELAVYLSMREKRLAQFEKSWCNCIITVILSNVMTAEDTLHQSSLERTFDTKLLKFTVDLEMVMAQQSQKSENIQQIFKVIVSESFGKTSAVSLKAVFQAEFTSPILDDKVYHTEHFSLVALSELFQEKIIRASINCEKPESARDFIQIILSENFDKLTVLQKVIYFAIFREITHQILKDNFRLLESIYINDEDAMVVDQLARIAGFFAQLTDKPFQLYVLKQLYQLHKQDMRKIIQNSSFLATPWVTDFTQSFKRLHETDFLTPLEKSTYKKHFQNNGRETFVNLKELISSEMTFSRNVFRDIYDGIISKKYYPFMMFNNIQALFDRDSQNNTQLYQCLNCLEYIFSDQCPDLQSKHRCQQCGMQLAINNPNTKRVLQNAATSMAELHKIINEDQWKGYYIVLEEDRPDFKLNEGTSFDLRLFCLVYNITIILSKAKNYRYYYESKESIIDFNNNLREVTVKELNKQLKIHFEANADEHLQSQAQLAIKHIGQYLMKIYKVKQDDVGIILFKFAYTLLGDHDIKSCETTTERATMNAKIADNSKLVFDSLSRLAQVEQQFSQKILEQQESLQLETNFKRNLRYSDLEFSLDHAYVQLVEQIPNNEYQVLKKLLAFSEVNQISRILKVFARFYKYLNREFSNKFSLKKAQDLSLLQALKGNKNDPLYIFYIQELIPAWNELRTREKTFQVECESVEIGIFNEHTKLNYLVFGDSKNTAGFSNGLELMCTLQNKYIHQIYQLSVIDSNENKVDSKLSLQVKALFENSEQSLNKQQPSSSEEKLKTIPLDLMNPSIHLVKSYNESIIKQYVFANLEYGQGKKYLFDLEQLQQRLVREVLTGAVLIEISRTVRFKYLNEVHQIGLLSNNTITQETIFYEIRQRIQRFFTSKEQAFEFLQQLSTIFQMFKGEILQAELSIKSALDTLQLKLKQENLKELLSEQLKLKHLNDLICCIEELQLDSLVELCNPYYKHPIQPEILTAAIEFVKTHMSFEEFSIALGRFTVRCLSSDVTSISPQANLFEQIFYSDIYSELWRDPQKLDKLYKDACDIPVLIGQAYDMYQHVQRMKNLTEISSVKATGNNNAVEEKPNLFL